MKVIISQLHRQIVDEEEPVLRGTVSHLGLPLYGRFKSCGNSNSAIVVHD
jgi:hypothetical protein